MALEAKNIICIDDFLSEKEFEELARYGESSGFTNVNSLDRDGIWSKNHDANPLTSGEFIFPFSDTYDEFFSAEQRNSMNNGNVNPYLEKIALLLNDHPQFLDFEECAGIVASIYKYSSHGGLIWHDDSDNYLGAFILYVHRDWDNNWGGSLLVSEGDYRTTLLDGRFIAPKPNRLVLLKSPVSHAISPVTLDSQTARLGLTGFFVKHSRVTDLIQRQNSDFERH